MNFEEKSRLSKRLRLLRSEKNISQGKVADDLNISKVSMSYYETGTRYPDIDLLVQFADYFNVSLDFLVGRSNIKSLDENIQSICEYTGLSENSVNSLKILKEEKKEIIEAITLLLNDRQSSILYKGIESKYILSKIADYLFLETNIIYRFRPSESDIQVPNMPPDADKNAVTWRDDIKADDILITQEVIEELILKEIVELLKESKKVYKKEKEILK